MTGVQTCALPICDFRLTHQFSGKGIALAVQVLPAFIAKQQLDTFASELVREAEIAGRIGPETDRRSFKICLSLFISSTPPTFLWHLPAG